MNRTEDEQATFRKYLLQDLDEAEQERVELRLLKDGEFRRRMALAQDDLFDDFVAGELSGREAERFREHFTATPARRHKLNFAAALDRYVTEKADAAPWFGRAFGFWRARPLRVAFSSALGLLVLAVCFYVLPRPGWLRLGRGQELRLEFARVNRTQGAGAATLSELRRSSADTAALTLRENVVRGSAEGRRAELGDGVSLLRLLLEVTSGPFESYRATLQTTDGREVAAAEGLKAVNEDGAQFVVVYVPAGLLSPGAYQMRLAGIGGDGRADDLGLYPFELSR